MNKNEFDVFEDPDDEILNEIAANYPILTEEEKERMFSMSERKYNITNNMNNNENGDEVSGVDRYTGRTWHRYAAVAAAFVLLAGGIGGSIALGKHMDKNKRSDDKLTATTAITTEMQTTSADATTAEYTNAVNDSLVTAVTQTAIVTAAEKSTETTTVTTDDRRDPSDLTAFAEEWKEKYEEYIWRIECGAVQHEENTVSFKLAEGLSADSLQAWKVTDEKYSSADAIYEFIRSVWAPGINETQIPDLTDKIDSGTAEFTDLSKSVFFTYKNELYRIASNAGLEGVRENLSAEKLNDNEMLVHWKLGYEGIGEEQSLHLVWVDEYNDWRIDELVDGSKYFGKPTEEEAKKAAKELFDGFKDVHNAKYGTGVKYDDDKRISFKIRSNDPSDGEWYVHYAKVTDSRFSDVDDVKAYVDSKYKKNGIGAQSVAGNDLSEYPEGSVFKVDGAYDASDNAYHNLTNYIMYKGELYLLVDSGYSNIKGVNNYNDINAYNLKHDPEVLDVKVINGNCIGITADEDTANTIDEHGYDTIQFCISRNDLGEWRVSFFGLDIYKK